MTSIVETSDSVCEYSKIELGPYRYLTILSLINDTKRIRVRVSTNIEGTAERYDEHCRISTEPRNDDHILLYLNCPHECGAMCRPSLKHKLRSVHTGRVRVGFIMKVLQAFGMSGAEAALT